MQEMTAMVVGYALILSVLLETMVILLIIPYVKPRVGKTFAYGILGSLLIFHDCFGVCLERVNGICCFY